VERCEVAALGREWGWVSPKLDPSPLDHVRENPALVQRKRRPQAYDQLPVLQ